ncbi:hypothetical protein D3C85_890060 [compost metagenome]
MVPDGLYQHPGISDVVLPCHSKADITVKYQSVVLAVGLTHFPGRNFSGDADLAFIDNRRYTVIPCDNLHLREFLPENFIRGIGRKVVTLKSDRETP